SEIRSAIPIRTLVANNIIYNDFADDAPIIAHDELSGIRFERNYVNNQVKNIENIKGIENSNFGLSKITDDIFIPDNKLSDVTPFNGFEFETIKTDLFGNSRSSNNRVGAIIQQPKDASEIFDKTKYGPAWNHSRQEELKEESIALIRNSNDLITGLENANPGDVLELVSGTYELNSPLTIDKEIIIRANDQNQEVYIIYNGPGGTPLFELHPKARLSLKSLNLKGVNKQYTFAPLEKNMSSLYNLSVTDTEVSNFRYILKAYKESFADKISFKNSSFNDCLNGIDLSQETDDKGDYNAEYVLIDNCAFNGVKKNVLNYYRGGYDESTVGGTLTVKNSQFSNCGIEERDEILLKTYGIINVDISNNRFRNNPIDLIALLWGAKNNHHHENEIYNSGKIVVEENLKQKLLY
ncbi:MAG: chondroitinase-B domain-containing protein, partial [Melioribacteraceae bacterium]|nr:chondroitinase-B domain-containing protein [Melioribacteraceae bacterium]